MNQASEDLWNAPQINALILLCDLKNGAEIYVKKQRKRYEVRITKPKQTTNQANQPGVRLNLLRFSFSLLLEVM